MPFLTKESDATTSPALSEHLKLLAPAPSTPILLPVAMVAFILHLSRTLAFTSRRPALGGLERIQNPSSANFEGFTPVCQDNGSLLYPRSLMIRPSVFSAF